ncbi:MAG TPA: response regulator transcription factor [Bacteroidia bacterium]|jgi:DNA-binding response OmpR family regulator|nr:response regulator transcription factor [Bacteroidia bacterium]
MKDTKPKILYVEDDVNLGFVTTDNLDSKGYSTVYCKDGKEGLETFTEGMHSHKKEKFDLCILDIMMPEMDGFTLAKEIRKINNDIPIIFLTAKTMKEDKITGFRTGADDYITKPFSIEELILRIEVFLKRSRKAESIEPIIFQLGKYEFNFGNLTLAIGKQKEILTMKEAELLRYFCQNKDKILKREDILRAVWGDDDYFMGRSLDVFISRLRKFLQKDSHIQIENIHSVGFRLTVK